ncbi:MAG: hypothetical protein ACREC3_17660 [Methyloceanibacter sp.]
MTNYASPRFWERYYNLPASVRQLADKSFDLFVASPQHPSLQFKKVGRFWSVRVSKGYRALAVEVEDGLLWTWIGPHDEYNRLIQ